MELSSVKNAHLLCYNLSNVVEHVERCGRTCYNSLDKIEPGSAEKFVKARINEGHYSIVEHANFLFRVDGNTYYKLLRRASVCEDCDVEEESVVDGAKALNFSSVIVDGEYRYLVSGNARAWSNVQLREALEVIPEALRTKEYDRSVGLTVDVPGGFCTIIPDIFKLKDITKTELITHTYFTFRFVTDVGAYKDLTRHRKCSFTIESTRWVDYHKERNGGSLCFIDNEFYTSEEERKIISRTFQHIEDAYESLSADGSKTDVKRTILPHGLSAKCVMTANLAELRHMFNLRYKQTTGNVNPVVAATMEKIYKLTREYLMLGFGASFVNSII